MSFLNTYFWSGICLATTGHDYFPTYLCFFLRIDVAFTLQSIHTQLYATHLKAMALIFLPVPGNILFGSHDSNSFSDIYYTVIFKNNLILIREIYFSSHFQRPGIFYLHTNVSRNVPLGPVSYFYIHIFCNHSILDCAILFLMTHWHCYFR